MKKLLYLAAAASIVACVTASCDDNDNSPIGSSLVKDQVEIIVDSTYVLTGHPVASERVQSRTILQLLGRIDAKGYGSFASDVVTQLMPTENMATEGVTSELIDSVKMIMRIPLGGYVGDSITPMGVKVYRLNKQLEAPIYSSFNPEGYYDKGKPLSSAVYSVTKAGQDNSVATSSAYRYLGLKLDRQFGVEMFERYKSNPETFSTPEAFASWFPGLYVSSSFGNGRVVQIDSTVVTTWYRQVLPIEGTDRDTTLYRQASYLAVTPEIITNNNMNYRIDPALKARAEAGEPVLVAPTGYDVEIVFPTAQILEAYRSQSTELSVINKLSFRLPVDLIENDYGLTPPPYVLMVLSTEKDNFFLRSRLPDNVKSFYAAYNSYRGCYDFTDMRDYILEMLKKDELKPEDYTFTIVPVTVGFESNNSSNMNYYYYYYGGMPSTALTVSAVTPYVNRPSMGLLGLDRAKITFTYSSQKLNF